MKKIKLITLIIVIISSLFILTGCTSNISEAETEKQFVLIDSDLHFDVYYHKKTKVMYVVSDGEYNRGTFTLLVDAEGKPLLYEGE